MWGLLFIGLIGGYCVGSFVVCVCCCCRGSGVRVDELELVGVVCHRPATYEHPPRFDWPP